MITVLMHGPAFDDTGQLVEREVPVGDIDAFERAGYKKGGFPGTATALPEVPVRAAPDEQLPADFPCKSILERAGIFTYGDLGPSEDLTLIDGIGPAHAEKIIAWLITHGKK